MTKYCTLLTFAFLKIKVKNMSILLHDNETFYKTKNVHTQLIKLTANLCHRHDFIEFFYVVSGSATHLFNGKKDIIKRGDAFLLVPGDEHCFENGTNSFIHRDILFRIDYFKSICDLYSPTLFNRIICKDIPLSFTIDSHSESKLDSLCENLEIRVRKPSDLLEKQIVFEVIGSLIFRDKEANKKSNEVVNRLIKFLSSPEYYKYSISEILKKEKIDYCQEYVCRTFKKYTGMTMTSFFNLNKIEYAKTLKQSGFYSISEIREIINIDNESYFYKLVKKFKDK